MKKLLTLLLSVALLATSLFALTACGGISGTYVSQAGSIRYEFSSKEVVRTDAFLDYETVYTYEMEKSGNSRYLLLTLKEYTYDGEDKAVADYVKSLNDAIAGKEQKAERLVFLETAEGTVTIGKISFIKED